MTLLDDHSTHVQMSVAFMNDAHGNFARITYHYVEAPHADWSLDYYEASTMKDVYQNLFEYFDGKDSAIVADDYLIGKAK